MTSFVKPHSTAQTPAGTASKINQGVRRTKTTFIEKLLLISTIIILPLENQIPTVGGRSVLFIWFALMGIYVWLNRSQTLKYIPQGWDFQSLLGTGSGLRVKFLQYLGWIDKKSGIHIALLPRLNRRTIKPMPKSFSGSTDAIIAGQGEGPLSPRPIDLGMMTLGTNTAAVEWVHAILMGFGP